MLYQALLLSCVLATAAAVVCDKDDECTQAQFCLDNKCEDPCKDGCGIQNTTCEVVLHRPVCSPVSKKVLNVSCSDDSIYFNDQVGLNHICEDLCKDGCGVANTICKVINHRPFCSCLPSHYGDPTTGCEAGCSEDGDCPIDQECANHKCKDPCRGGCGVNNTVCKVTNHRSYCSCLPGHYGDPTTSCTAGCNEDIECTNAQACLAHKCVDPCKGGCGMNNTVCKVTDHRPFCSCQRGYQGDPTTGCKEYHASYKTLHTTGYDYKETFKVTLGKKRWDGVLFTLKFLVKTPSDAHILLSSSPSTNSSSPTYEIVLGGNENKFSAIRPGKQKRMVADNNDSNIVSLTSFKGFWVKRYQNGLLAVGREGSDIPFMSWQDPEPLDIHYVSFSSYRNVAADWLLDCIASDIERCSTTGV